MTHFTNLKIDDLNKLGDYTHNTTQKKRLNNDKNVMKGHLFYQFLGKGLSMHFVDMKEIENISFSNQTPAGISFNLVYQGKIDFTLGNHHHEIHSNKNKPTCGCFALNKPEMRTRHTNKDMQVKKINVFAEKKWLLDRAQNKQERDILNRAFNAHSQLMTWQASNASLNVIEELINLDKKQSYTQNIHIEAKILYLLSILLHEMFEQLIYSENSNVLTKESTSQLFISCRKLLDKSSDNPMSLSDIAEQLNVSISTLQRRFKEASGMTVIEYIRLQRLDKSRRDLVENGLSIGEIAYTAGYKHVANFVSAFKREYSVSPNAYRKIHSRTVN